MKRINLAHPDQEIPHKKSQFSYKKAFLFVVVLIAIGIYILSKQANTSVFEYLINNVPTLTPIESRVNILLLGNAGGTHDGANLTDTIIVASVDPESRRAHLISLPRDLWLDSIQHKINTVYDAGKKQGNPLEFSKKQIGDILGMPIHYALRIDFRGFEKAVDEVGGVDIVVDKSFDDYKYPIAGKEADLCGYTEQEVEFNEEEAKKLNVPAGKGKYFSDPAGNIATDSAKINFECRYEHLAFKAGLTHMDGVTALKYVRSRMGTNGEGSDFARSKRQQKVIDALRQKVLSLETLGNPAKLKSLMDTFGESFETDIPISEAVDLYKLAKKIETTDTFVLGSTDTNLFINPPLSQYGGAWVLVPREKDFVGLQRYIKDIINGEVVNVEASSSARSGSSGL